MPKENNKATAMAYLGEKVMESPQELTRRLGLDAKGAPLIRRALTHRSFANEQAGAVEDNEKLEFLGDAVLNFVTGAWLYNRFPELQEGELTRMRASLVRTEQLASFARQMELGKALRLGRGEDQAGGRDKDALLCAAFEAIIGAMYLLRDIEPVKEFINPFIEHATGNIIFSEDFRDPKSQLQEWSQGRKMGIPKYLIAEATGPDHQRKFMVEVWMDGKCYGRGEGHNKQDAEQAAAQFTLNQLKEEKGRRCNHAFKIEIP